MQFGFFYGQIEAFKSRLSQQSFDGQGRRFSSPPTRQSFKIKDFPHVVVVHAWRAVRGYIVDAAYPHRLVLQNTVQCVLLCARLNFCPAPN